MLVKVITEKMKFKEDGKMNKEKILTDEVSQWHK